VGGDGVEGGEGREAERPVGLAEEGGELGDSGGEDGGQVDVEGGAGDGLEGLQRGSEVSIRWLFV
jgi:hypothetical protein